MTLALCCVYACLHLFVHLLFMTTLGNRYYEHSFFPPLPPPPQKWKEKFRKINRARREVNSLTTRPIKPLPPVSTLCLSSCFMDEWSLLLAKATSMRGLDLTMFTYSRSLFGSSLPFSSSGILNCSLPSGPLPSACKYVIKLPSLKSLFLTLCHCHPIFFCCRYCLAAESCPTLMWPHGL